MAILTFEVKGQTLTVKSSIGQIIENSINYLEFKIINNDNDWKGLTYKAIVSNKIGNEEAIYPTTRGEGTIPKEKIKTPGFQISILGYAEKEGIITKQITTNPIFIAVAPSGEIVAEKIETPPTGADPVEQINSRITSEINEVNKTITNKENTINQRISNEISGVNETINASKETLQEDFASKINQLKTDLYGSEDNTIKGDIEILQENISGNANGIESLKEDLYGSNKEKTLENSIEDEIKKNQNKIRSLKKEHDYFTNSLKKQVNAKEGEIATAENVSPVEHEIKMFLPEKMSVGYYTKSDETGNIIYNGNDVYRTLEIKSSYKTLKASKKIMTMRIIKNGNFSQAQIISEELDLTSEQFAGAQWISFRLAGESRKWESDTLIEIVCDDGNSIYFADSEFSSGGKIFARGKNLFEHNILSADMGDETYSCEFEKGSPKPLTISFRALPNLRIMNDNPVWRFHIIRQDGRESYIMDLDKACYTFPSSLSDNPIVKVEYRTNKIVTGGYYNVQMEFGEMATEFQEYKGTEYTIDSSGSVEEIKSISPIMHIFSDNEKLPLSFEHNLDINKVYQNLSV